MTKRMTVLLWVLLCGVLTVLSCASFQGTKLTYEQVNFEDGISNWEAVLIAQEHLKRNSLAVDYHFDHPNLFLDQYYPNKWFVQFQPLYMGMRLTDYLVMIDKNTGKIDFSNYWWPNEQTLDDIVAGRHEAW